MTQTESRQGPLILIDGMSLAFRAYFALPPDLATVTGVVTNAVHGFTSMLVNIVRDHRPGALAVAFDVPGPTFRDEVISEYKAGRAETPDDLMPQFDMIKDLLGVLAVPCIGLTGYEADDVLATLATEARDRGGDVIVVTGDRDCFQLVEDPHVKVLYNRRGVSDYSLYDAAGIVERTGVQPEKYPMLAALRGDPSDNLPGVPGVGEKTAAKLLNTYGDLDAIFANLDALSPKLRQNLAEHEAQVRANFEVIPLVRDVEMDVAVDDLTLGGWDLAEAREHFAVLELRTIWRRMVALLAEGYFGPPAPGSEPVDAAAEEATFLAVDTGTGAPRRDGDGAEVAGVGPPSQPLTVDPESVRGEVVADEEAALAAVRSLASAPRVALAGRWEGLRGRSALQGLLLLSGEDEQGVWLGPDLLSRPPVARALCALLKDVPQAGHAVKELLRSLLPLGIDARRLEMDTSVAAYLLDPSTGDYSLAQVIETVSGAKPLDGAGEDRPTPTRKQGQLALGDGVAGAEPADEGERIRLLAHAAAAEAVSVVRLVEPLCQRLDADGLRTLHDGVECPLVRVLARMEVTGIRVDAEELRRVSDELAGEVKELEQEIHRLAGHEFKVNSTPQLRTVLYDELGLTPGRKTKTGYSTDAATLESLRDVHPIVDTLLRYRELEKLRSTYGENLIAEVAEDGRIHASFGQTVARTGRLASERPNLHNIPVRSDVGRQFRRAFVPAEGCRFLVADYDQIELRVLAHLSRDPGLVDAFTSGTDVHRAVAGGIWSVAPEEVTRSQREEAKMVSYGLAYGLEAYGLARRLATGVEHAAEIMDRYFQAFPEVRAYMDATVAEARSRGFTRTALGRKRPLPDLNDRNYRVRLAAERQAMNAGIQGLAADLFKTALVRLDEALEEQGLASRLVLQVHDEVLVEAVVGEEETVAALTESSLTGAADLTVPLKVSMSWGDSWAEAKGG